MAHNFMLVGDSRGSFRVKRTSGFDRVIPLLTSGHGYSFMPANAALRCQSNKAVRSSRAQDDGVVGSDL